MAHTILADFFTKNIEPSFVEFGWDVAEINALRGAFYLGAQTALNHSGDDLEVHDILLEVETFQKNANTYRT